MNRTAIITNEDTMLPVAEAFRILRTNIQFSNINNTIKSIVITSPGPNEGKSTVLINLAVTMAHANKKVLLIDSNLRKPTIHKFIEVHNYTGLTNVLVDNIDYKKIVKSIAGIKNLDILISGPFPPNPSELLESHKMKLLLEKAKEDYDMVLLDSPSVGLVTDAAILSTMVDGTILVCEVGETEIKETKYAKSSLQKINANILGVVMNKIPLDKDKYCKYDNYHSYYVDKEYKATHRKRKRAKKNT